MAWHFFHMCPSRPEPDNQTLLVMKKLHNAHLGDSDSVYAGAHGERTSTTQSASERLSGALPYAGVCWTIAFLIAFDSHRDHLLGVAGFMWDMPEHLILP